MRKEALFFHFITGSGNKRNPKNIVIIALSLFLILFFLCAYHQTNYKYHREYPSVKMITSDYPNYIGETASISGEVVGVPSTTFQLLESEDGKNALFTVLPDSHVDVDIGDKVEVLGSLGPDYQIYAEKIIVSKKWKYEFVFVRSFIGLILLIFVFMRNWKFNIANGICEEGIKMQDWLAQQTLGKFDQQPFRKSLTKNVSPASQVLLVKFFSQRKRG